MTWSWAPTLTPPERTTTSAQAAPSRTSASSSGSVSRATPSRRTSAPASAAWAASASELLSWIWAGPSGRPGGTSSSPVEMTATRGRRWTDAEACPVAASRPIAAGSSARPRSNRSKPAATSVPARRTFAPVLAAARISTVAGISDAPAGASVSSTGTTVSAPGGIIAPVMIRSAVPGSTAASGARPAGTSPRTRRTTGASRLASATSPARTAKPSIALLGQGGTVRAERTGSASTRPAAPARSTTSAGSASMPSSTLRWASASGIRSGRSGIGALLASPAGDRVRLNCQDTLVRVESWRVSFAPGWSPGPTSSPQGTPRRRRGRRPRSCRRWRRSSAGPRRRTRRGRSSRTRPRRPRPGAT